MRTGVVAVAKVTRYWLRLRDALNLAGLLKSMTPPSWRRVPSVAGVEAHRVDEIPGSQRRFAAPRPRVRSALPEKEFRK
jgi:hypothetical protein